MRAFVAAILSLGLIATTASLLAEDKVEAKGDKVEYSVHDGHFVKNTYQLNGDSAYVAVGDRTSFDNIFGVGRVLKNQNLVPNDAFEKKIVVAAMKKGAAVAQYKVEKVTVDGESILYVQYTVDTKGSGGTATFVSPLIISVDKGKIKSVIFVENGKKADAVDLAKGS